MLAVIRDPDVEQQRKDRMAEVAAPYMHAKLSAIEVNRTGRVNQETINVVQIFAVPRGGSLDINAGVITVDGSPLEPMSIEPFEPTPGLVIEDQTMVREPPEPLPVIEVDEAANVTPLSSWRKRDE